VIQHEWWATYGIYPRLMYPPLRACTSKPPCVVPHRGPCPRLTPAWRPADGVLSPRIRGRKLQQLRRQLFRDHPCCVQCLISGRTTPPTIRDHIIPLAEGGCDEPANIQALCQMCSDAKTAAEARRGQMRQIR
jgi:5-methylcytosine-specific restriction protein A